MAQPALGRPSSQHKQITNVLCQSWSPCSVRNACMLETQFEYKGAEAHSPRALASMPARGPLALASSIEANSTSHLHLRMTCTSEQCVSGVGKDIMSGAAVSWPRQFADRPGEACQACAASRAPALTPVGTAAAH